jgi:cytochrome c oxidase cbb3-type subunit 3
MSDENENLLDHNFDGIEEYDNPLPPWWVYLFVLTIIWAGLYLFYFHISGMGPGSDDEYANEIKNYQIQFASVINAEAGVNWNEPNFEKLTDPTELDKGKALFIKNCVSCHGNEGQGGIGPNFTDKYWIHGGGINNVAKTIALGVPEKGMITWKTTFKKNDIIALASYVLSLQGTNPPNPKAPQGDLFEEK